MLVDLLIDEGVHGGFGYGSRNSQGDRILEFGDAIEMVEADIFFKKRYRRFVTYQPSNSSSQLDYVLLRESNRKMDEGCEGRCK